MKISQIPLNSPVSVRVQLDGKEREFSAKVMQGGPEANDPDYVTVTPFMKHTGKGQDVRSGDVYYYSNSHNSCLMWKGAMIRKYEDRYLMREPGEGATIDRRGAQRVELDLPCSVTLKNPKEPRNGRIHDISVSGVAVVFQKDEVSYTEAFNKTLHIRMDLGEGVGECELDCICKNVRKSGEDQLLCGCTILKSTVDLADYLNLKAV
ncbi:MAG: PilZ domain-containing protein [Lachnospiraceae bacterium]|nr:PilZ domain-containing protein [Lachnospiraceae bacterium]